MIKTQGFSVCVDYPSRGMCDILRRPDELSFKSTNKLLIGLLDEEFDKCFDLTITYDIE